MSRGSELEKRLRAAPPVIAAREALADSPNSWIVGGAVRDALLGEEVHNIDLAVEPGQAEPAARAIAGRGRAVSFPLSEEHATWRVVSRQAGWHADVTALRDDSIDSDLRARDFALNAIAVPLAGGDPIDPLDGLADADARRLRATSDRAFADDPLRLLRAVRLATRHGLEIDAETAALARREAGRAGEPAGERQFAELRGIVAGPDPLRALELMDELGLTAQVLPELERTRGVVQTPNHHLDVHGHTLAVLEEWLAIESNLEATFGEIAPRVAEFLAEPLADELTRGGALRFGALLHDLGKPDTRAEQGGHVTFIGHDKVGADLIAGIARRLRTSRTLSTHLQGLALHHLRLGFMVRERPLSRRAVYGYLRATEPVAADVTLLTAADRRAARGEGPIASEEMIAAHIDLVRELLPDALDWHREPPRPPLDGNDLAEEIGVQPGPRMGEILEELRAASYAGEISGREAAIERARSLVQG